MKPCPFCAIGTGEAAAHRVYEDAATLAFLDKSPLAIGHVLLIPRAHVESLFDAEDTAVEALARASRLLAVALRRALECDGVFVAQNNVVSQSVPHLHVHLVPRFKGDGLFARGSMVWRRVRYADEAQMHQTAAKIRACLESEASA